MHGEADFVTSRGPTRVLDAGCGTGRVAIELHRRGIDVVGTDVDTTMLGRAREKAPELSWHEADLAELDLRDGDGVRETFDLVLLAGNVMIFLDPGSEPRVVARLAEHLVPGGALVAGFQLRPQGLGLDDYDAMVASAGLELAERYATWDGQPFAPSGDYAVSVSVLR